VSREPGRPDPDALLAAVNREERPTNRGRFKIFFGFSPGVGKTFAMLEAARRLSADGADVVAGIVETHGRGETARLLDGIEVLPRLEVPYRGHILREFDLDGAIARRPALLLVDELAHTNAPGVRHEKRWQDILDVLASGIDVHSTLNVQHVESVVDLVEGATGIRVRETVPDTVLERADEIELIDLPPDELLSRLRDGKIYLPEVAKQAVERFFKRSNLLQLRELALVRMAQRVGSDVLETRRATARPAAGVAERIVVGVGSGHGSTRAIRDAARIATGLRAEWTAVTVRRPFARPPRVATADALEENLRLAESLGGRIERVAGTSIAAGLLDEARRVAATRIVVGRPRKTRWRRPFREPVLDRLVQESGPIDVVVAGSAVSDLRAAPATPIAVDSIDLSVRTALPVLAMVGLAFAGGWAMRPWVDDHDMAVVSLLIVVSAALRFGRAAGILAVVLSALGIDFLFLHPRYQLAIAETKEIVSLVLLLSVGIVVAELVMRMRSQRERAIADERRLARLLELSRRLSSSATADDAAEALADTAADVTNAGVEVKLACPAGDLRTAARSGGVVEHAAADAGVMLWSHEFGQPAGRGMNTLPGAKISCLPIREAGRGLGVLVIGCDPPRDLTRDQLELVTSASRQAAARLVMIEQSQVTSDAARPEA
jgi:two-component system sensor histidine kinase KdpD